MHGFVALIVGAAGYINTRWLIHDNKRGVPTTVQAAVLISISVPGVVSDIIPGIVLRWVAARYHFYTA